MGHTCIGTHGTDSPGSCLSLRTTAVGRPRVPEQFSQLGPSPSPSLQSPGLPPCNQEQGTPPPRLGLPVGNPLYSPGRVSRRTSGIVRLTSCSRKNSPQVSGIELPMSDFGKTDLGDSGPFLKAAPACFLRKTRQTGKGRETWLSVRLTFWVCFFYFLKNFLPSFRTLVFLRFSFLESERESRGGG